MSRIFFTGCTHFDHANIIRLAKRPFQDVQEMNAEMVRLWNETVGHGDTVFHLGDFAFDKAGIWRDRLNGQKVLIEGNHDKNRAKPDHKYLEIEVGGRKVVLFHYPIEEWNGFYRGAVHVHCHTHSPIRVTGKNRVNVSVEAWDYTPVSFDQILAELEKS